MSMLSGKILKSSITISFFTLLTGIFNYLNLFLLALTFGAGMEMDAFFAATTIPQIVIAILSGILATTFIPVFIETKAKDESNAWKVASISINIIFLALFVGVLVGFLSSNSIIALINPGFPLKTSTLSVSLFRILLFSLIFSGSSMILTSLHYAHQRFFKPSFAQGINSLITFLFVLNLRSTLGIKSIAIGTLVGSLIQFVYLLPVFFKKGRYSFVFDFKKKEILKLARLMFPLLIGSIFYKSNNLVERFIASKLGEGCVSYLGYAYKIILALSVVISQGVSTALFPRMAEFSAIKDYKALKEILSKGIRVLIIITVPIAFMIILARFELVRLIFERGHFDSQTTIAVGKTLLAYLGFFVVVSISLPIVNTLYSLQETTKVAVVGIFGFTLYVFLAFFLSNYFSYIGIALAVSIQYVINFLIFVYIIKLKKIGFENQKIFICTFKATLASGMSSFIILESRKFHKSLIGYPYDLIVWVILGFCLYFVALVILKTEEVSFLKINMPFLKKRR